MYKHIAQYRKNLKNYSSIRCKIQVCMGRCPWRPEESVRFSGAGGTVGFEF